MPFIQIAPLTVDQNDPNALNTYYQSLGWTIQANATSQNDGISFVAYQTNQAELNLRALCGGQLRIVAQGQNQVISDLSINTSSNSAALVLTPRPTSISAYGQALIPGMPHFTDVIYKDVQGVPLIDQLLPAVQRLHDNVLIAAWNETNSPDIPLLDPNNDPPLSQQDRDPLEIDYLNRLMTGALWVDVEPGEIIGTAYLNSADEYTFELYFRMCDGPPSSNALTASPVTFIRRMPDFNNLSWGMHPAIGSVLSLPLPLKIYVRFRTWNTLQASDPNEATYVNIDEGITVKLMHNASSPEYIDEVTLDSNGVAFFDLSTQPNVGPNELPDLYFELEDPEAPNADLPSEWDSRSWSGATTIGILPGLMEDFLGTNLGTPLDPVFYRVGVDYHFKIRYENPKGFGDTIGDQFLPAPEGIKIYLMKDADVVVESTISKNGYFRGVTFEIAPGDSVHLKIECQLDDDTIENARIILVNQVIQTIANSTIPSLDPDDYTTYEFTTIDNPLKYSDDATDAYLLTPVVGFIGKYAGASLVDSIVPWQITLYKGWPRAAFYVIKVLKEWGSFWKYFTQGDFVLSDQVIFMNTPMIDVSMNLFRFGLYLRTASDFLPDKTNPTLDVQRGHFFRGTIFHELTHSFIGAKLGTEISAIYENSYLAIYANQSHGARKFTNANFSFLEGVPEFIESIATGDFTNDARYRLDGKGGYTISHAPVMFDLALTQNIPPTTLNPVSPIPLSLGNHLEGAFRNTLYLIFKDVICDNTGLSTIIPKPVFAGTESTVRLLGSRTGDLVETNPWMSQGNQSILVARFNSYFMEPLESLASWYLPSELQFPDTTAFYEALLSSTPVAFRHIVLAKLARFNCHLNYDETPLTIELDVTTGTTNTLVTITSEDDDDIFPANDAPTPSYDDNVEVFVRFGLVSVVCDVNSSREITFLVPSNYQSTTILDVKVVVRIRTVEFESNAVSFQFQI
ncbi:MAG: hypothetical protein RL204_484 [Bacteroidota bacterium]